MENGNTQTPAAQPGTPAGKTVEQLQAELDSLKKESEGRLRDLQSERAKRQELEGRLTPAPVEQTVEIPQDELGKVLKPYVQPLMDEIQQAKKFVAKTMEDKAMDYLSSKTGKTRDQIMADKDLQNQMVDIVKRYGFNGNIVDVTVKAYEIMELEKLRSAENERRRVAEINANTSVSTGNMASAPVTGSREWTPGEWSRMSTSEYAQYEGRGHFRKADNGNFVFVPDQK